MNIRWSTNSRKRFLFFQISERRYGCYRLGIVAACIIVLVLIVGTIPASLTIRNNKIVLILLCATLVVVLILLSLFIIWQQRHARRMRERYGRPYVPHIYNQVIVVWLRRDLHSNARSKSIIIHFDFVVVFAECLLHVSADIDADIMAVLEFTKVKEPERK